MPFFSRAQWRRCFAVSKNEKDKNRCREAARKSKPYGKLPEKSAPPSKAQIKKRRVRQGRPFTNTGRVVYRFDEDTGEAYPVVYDEEGEEDTGEAYPVVYDEEGEEEPMQDNQMEEEDVLNLPYDQDLLNVMTDQGNDPDEDIIDFQDNYNDRSPVVERAPRPTRKPSVYNIYMKEEMARLHKRRPKLSHREVFKTAAMGWKNSKRNPRKQSTGGRKYTKM